MKRPMLALSLVAIALAGYGGVFGSSSRKPEKGRFEASPCCSEYRFVVSGSVEHRTKPTAVKVEGAGGTTNFDTEVYGQNFAISLPGLPEGRYTVAIYMAETYFRSTGQRTFDVSLAGKKIAENLDLIAVAGFANSFVLKAETDHAADPIGGPLAVQFEAHTNNAKVDAIEVRNSRGDLMALATGVDLVSLQDRAASIIPKISGPVVYTDATQSTERRVADLVRRMSLKEKVEQLMDAAPPIQRLGVPGYNYWNECLHGVARAGHATVFPQAIGMAAAWDPILMHRIADTIATEARAKNNAARAANPQNTARYYGLTFWTPNINIFRDPRWGRGQETYGEDPYLTSRLAVGFIKGLQGDDPNYVKAMACAKHFAVHSGPEKTRHVFDAVPPERDLYETYLPQFEAAVREGKVGIVMSAYNAVNGVPAPASKFLLTDVLRKRWGFEGQVVSDCGAIDDVWERHRYVATKEQASAISVKAGTDIECGGAYAALVGAVNQGLIKESEIDVALKHVLKARFKLGLFDKPDRCAYLRIPASENNTPAHGKLSLETARESMTLLKNDGVLPFVRSKVRRIALIGPNSDSIDVLLGNYNGDPTAPITLRAGLVAAAGNKIDVEYVKGCPLALRSGEAMPNFDSAIQAAQRADVVVFAGGLDARLEGEEMPTEYEGFDRGDRVRIELPEVQNRLLHALKETGKPIVFVNLSGSAIAMPWAAENLSAILQAWYPGQAGGTAVADVLFGKFNPAGRLPVTFYASTKDLPAFDNYAMANRTYRYFKGKPLFPFGHGLSYTRYQYGALKSNSATLSSTGKLHLTLPVKNIGQMDGDEVVQVYVHRIGSAETQPIQSLAAFKRVSIAKGMSASVTLDLPATSLRRWDTSKKRYTVDPGKFEVEVGASSRDIRQTLRLTVIR